MMRRRSFVTSLAYAGLAARLRPPRAELRHWTWVHGDAERGPEEWLGRFKRARAAGIGAVLVGGGETSMIARAAESAGLRFHRWVWILNRSGDAWVKEHHPEWFTVSRNGESSLEKPPYVGYYQWLCPARPEVRKYLARHVAEVARHPKVHGVHLDYIRHCDVILPSGLWAKYGLVQDHEMAEFDFCYCVECRTAFRKAHGTDPNDLPDPATSVEWRRFRWDSVTGLVRELATAVKGERKRITAAVFPTPTIARTLVRQSWGEWPLDACFPMLYNGFYKQGLAWIGSSVREGVAALPPGRPLYAGLYLPDLTPDKLVTAVRTAADAGAAGVSLFELEGLTDSHFEALRAATG
jgi:uncharacterized lipoprotein YddW (UPF0748 family)